jgi:hypothetical protein
MILTTLIISCLTLIVVSVGLFLNLKSNRNIMTTIANFEESITAKVESVKSEISSKIQDFNDSTHSKFDTTKTEIQTTVKDNSKFVHEKLITTAKESDLNNYNAIESAKKVVIESLEHKMNETNLHLQKNSSDINSKVDMALQAQEKQQSELINEVQTKFSKIIEEIKSPLTLD